jgi:hypothetical protein
MKLNKPLSDLVVSRKVAQQLNPLLDKAGIEIEGNLFWSTNELAIRVNEENAVTLKNRHHLHILSYELTPTYLLEEVLGVLPVQFTIEGQVYLRTMMGSSFCYGEEYNSKTLKEKIFYFKTNHNLEKDNCATAAAKLLIWAIENGHVGGVK